MLKLEARRQPSKTMSLASPVLALAITVVSCPPAGLAYCALAMIGPSDGPE